MGIRVNAVAVISALALLGVGGWLISPTAVAAEGRMCPPTYIDDLFPDETTTTTTTAPPTTTSTTVPPPAPPTTVPAPTTTTVVAAPSTTVPEETTVVPPTTTPDTTVPPTTAPPTTAPETTVPPTTSPPTTAPAPSTTTPTAPTTTTTTIPPCDTPFLYPMVFPLLGAGDIGSPFGADRDGGRRHHMGNDIFAPKLQPVVAVADGTVTRIAGDSGISGYRVHVRHDDGWSSLYIHLNNDTAGTDDGNGIGIRPDLREGDRVAAGEVIGWNGDSGNAETTPPHLHFEIRDPAGDSVDPQPSLDAATRLAEPFAGPFADLTTEEQNPSNLAVLLSRGVPVWCDSPELVCPDAPLTSDRLHDWATSFGTGLPACENDCPGVTQADIARRVAWEHMHRSYQLHAAWLDDGVPDSMWTTPPPVPPASPSDLDLAAVMSTLGGTRRCLTPPNDSRELTTAQGATAFAVYMGWAQVPDCRTNSSNR